MNNNVEYNDSLAYIASSIFRNMLQDKIEGFCHTVLYGQLLSFTKERNLEFIKEGEFLYFGITIYLMNDENKELNSYIENLNNIKIFLKDYNIVEANIKNGIIFIYFKLDNNTRNFIENVIISNKAKNKYKL